LLLDLSQSTSRIIKNATQDLTSPSDLTDLKAFFASRETSSFARTCAQVIESVDAAGRWVSRDRKDVEAWLREKKFLV
jgi:aminopeptidase 2